MKKIILLLCFYISVAISSDLHLKSSTLCPTCNRSTDTIGLTNEQFLALVLELANKEITINNTTNTTTTVITSIRQELSNSVRALIQDTNKYADNIISYLSHYIVTNKYAVAGGTTLGLYLYVLYKSMRMHYFLHTDSHWHNWKKELSMEELCQITMANLSQSLLHSIQLQYINHQNPTDSITPLAKFMNAIEYEIKIIKRYISISSWCSRLKVSLFLPRHKALHELAQEKSRRLCFIKHIFTESIASGNAASVS